MYTHNIKIWFLLHKNLHFCALRGQSTLPALVCTPHLAWSLPYPAFMFRPCCPFCS